MASSNWNVTNFLAEVSSKGLAKPCRFEVMIDLPACVQDNALGQQVSMYCEQAQLPYTRILTSRQQLFGPPSFHPVGVEYNGEGVSLQFFVDRDMQVKRFFDAWANGIIDRTTFTANYQQNYLSQIYVSQLDEADNITYKCKLIDAFPTTVQALQLDGSMAGQVHRLNVTFNFRKWIEVAVGLDEKARVTKSTPIGNIGIVNGQIDFKIGPDFRSVFNGNQTEPGGSGYSNIRDSYYLNN